MRIDGITAGWVTVPFVIDTGAAMTCVHALDAIRLLGMSPASLDSSTWTNVIDGGGVGGPLKYLGCTAQFAFQRANGTLEFLDGEVKIGELRSGQQWMPALLGWDLLQHFRLTIDGGGQAVTLDRI